MPKKKTSAVEQSGRARKKGEIEACKKAILNRLYTSSATIEELDSAAGCPKPLVNSAVLALLHKDRITNRGFTYYYKHLTQALRGNLKPNEKKVDAN